MSDSQPTVLATRGRSKRPVDIAVLPFGTNAIDALHSKSAPRSAAAITSFLVCLNRARVVELLHLHWRASTGTGRSRTARACCFSPDAPLGRSASTTACLRPESARRSDRRQPPMELDRDRVIISSKEPPGLVPRSKAIRSTAARAHDRRWRPIKPAWPCPSHRAQPRANWRVYGQGVGGWWARQDSNLRQRRYERLSGLHGGELAYTSIDRK